MTPPPNSQHLTSSAKNQNENPLFERLGTMISIIAATGIVITCGGAIGFRKYIKNSKKIKVDDTIYMSIVYFFSKFAKQWTELLFGISLLSNLIFVGIGVLIFWCFDLIWTILVTWHQTYQWKKLTIHYPGRLSSYLNHNLSIVFGLSMVTSFYDAIGLLTSKIGTWKLFHLPLTKYETNEMETCKFIQNVVMNIVPQAVAQIIYLIDNKNDVSVIGAITIFWSMIMLTLRIIKFASSMKEKRCKSVDTYTDATDVTLVIQLKSASIQKEHALSTKLIQTAVQDEVHTFVESLETSKQKVYIEYDMFHAILFETKNEILYYLNVTVNHDANDQVPQSVIQFLVEAATLLRLGSVKYFCSMYI